MGKFLLAWLNSEKNIIIKTSGTTGISKEIRFEKKALVESALLTGKFFNLKEKTKVLHCLPMSFIAGKMMLVRAIILGWHLDIISPNKSPLKDIKEEYDFSAMVPFQVKNSFDHLPKIKKLLIGGAVISDDLREKLFQYNMECYEAFGMTETLTHIAVRKIEKENKPFKTLPNIEIKKNKAECLVIFAPHIKKEKIITKDVVNLITPKEFYWLGRKDNIINSGGIKFFPEKIEDKIKSVIKNDFFIADMEDNLLGKKIILVVESNLQPQLFEKIKKITTISRYELPKKIFFIEKFNRSLSGKIQRKKTLEMLFSKREI